MIFLLNLIEDLMNRQLNYAQSFNKTKQRDNQTIRKFDAYLFNLKFYLTLYTKQQQMTHLFMKLRSSIRDVVMNYQNIFKTRIKLLMITTRVKNNLKKKQRKFQEDKNNDKNSINQKRKNDKNDDKNDNKTSRQRRDRRDSKTQKLDKNENHSKFTCYIYNKKRHISSNCSNKNKKKFSVNAINSKKSKKNKTFQISRSSREAKSKNNL